MGGWLIYIFCFLVLVGAAVGIWWFAWGKTALEDKRILRAVDNARWEQQDTLLSGNKVAVEIVKVARWGDGHDQQRILDGPERIMIVDRDTVDGPTYDDACEAAAIRMIAANSMLRPVRRR